MLPLAATIFHVSRLPSQLGLNSSWACNVPAFRRSERRNCRENPTCKGLSSGTLGEEKAAIVTRDVRPCRETSTLQDEIGKKQLQGTVESRAASVEEPLAMHSQPFPPLSSPSTSANCFPAISLLTSDSKERRPYSHTGTKPAYAALRLSNAGGNPGSAA